MVELSYQLLCLFIPVLGNQVGRSFHFEDEPVDQESDEREDDWETEDDPVKLVDLDDRKRVVRVHHVT